MKKERPLRVVALVTPISMTGRDMLSGMLDALETETNCELKLFQESHSLTAEIIERLCRDARTGFLISLPPTGEAFSSLARLRQPIVYVNVRDPESGNANVRYVWNDNAAIGRMAALHLSERKTENFAFAGVADEDWSKGRENGFKAALPPSATFERKEFPLRITNRDERNRLRDWLLALPKPVAVFAACDYLAHAIETVCRDTAIAIPSQIALIGVDDDHHQISTVMPNYREMGRVATRTLLTMMHGKRCPVDPIEIEPTHAILRPSTKLKRTSAQLASRVLEHIAAHFAEDIGVTDVAVALGVSRSSLEHRFREATKASVREAIESARLKAVRELLRSGRHPLREIAVRCGFSSAAHLAHRFRRRFGLSPVAWSRMHAANRHL